ncbi:aminopeptidase P family protein [Entomospira culicis]|uniref:M24 family metallopeptidase n=1 Tax=Entomospira culicis TaxID=2719989 RepID=A0A968KZK1_9SPIO|nr:aminopeptidase P family protein [Entomospira culicis]NIZ19212.1 M24 family metallopeptidase [Entomospira culicis]NIZ69426.1 M24 family metallopeptidase [Entomospira culicis]WDI36542.1 aminopeptidase P family N-terminal domain-containing protein [Entomospira culicis]WDI38168.1 aminopeptidase P family N-terminal domain-containing protein [Entomospira culicis]
MNRYDDTLKLIRQALLRHKMSAYIFLSSDPHASEYLADRFQARAFFSHFHGSAGTFVVTTTEALLWCDGRYHLEATKLCDDLGMTLMKDGLPQTPSILDYLIQHLPADARIGIDAQTTPTTLFSQWQKSLATQKNIHLIGEVDLYQEIIPTRPPLPAQPIYPLPEQYTGVSTKQKLQSLADILKKEQIASYLICPLDSLAYILNLRGSDVEFNPFFYGYLLVHADATADLFCATEALTPEAHEAINQAPITIHPYETIGAYLQNIDKNTIYSSAQHLNHHLYQQITAKHTLSLGHDWVQHLKMIKNETEIHWLKTQYRQDGVAYVRFLKRLEDGEFHSEYDVVLALTQEREKEHAYRGESFPSIVGTASNGAIVHYRPTLDHHAPLTDGLLVIDSGAHYWGATTDITRTPCIGKPSLMAKYDYTMVLRAHIALASTPFPEFSTGAQLDGITRALLWREGINFGHGTGHGVGAMLSVHEEPFRINKLNTIPIRAGMTISNEPGIYRQGIHGVRLENIYISRPSHKENLFDTFLEWEPLTLVPFHTHAIEKSLMNPEEIAWVNLYHKKVYDELSPHLDAEHQAFLAKLTAPI